MKHYDFTDDPHQPWSCPRWCKVHWWWDFESENHVRYPQTTYWQTGPPVNGRRQWSKEVVIHCGPPAYYPKRPKPDAV